MTTPQATPLVFLKPFATSNPPSDAIATLQIPAGYDLKKELVERAKQLAEQIALQVGALDSILKDIDFLLNDFQPALTGKIRVLWVFRDGLVRPQPVQYRRSKADGKWKYKNVGAARLAKRARSAHAFHRNIDIVYKLLEHVTLVMNMRTALISTITQTVKVGGDRLEAVGSSAQETRLWLDKIVETKDNWRRFSLFPLSEEYVDET